jgi:Amt family ammonium transporter
VFAAPSLGGGGAEDFSIASQVAIQAEAVVITIVWSGVVAFVALFLIRLVIGLRASDDEQREGLDLSSHGESAYN